ncbi:hypothetical protein [Novosphingobium sp. AAP83]|uniref:hypothetical protein n=1 Tax=Novosphingobium sp. AAP83 TaxID=1523425 RepID=UPI0018D19F6E|nr:hypothetical protein [Novosphingobium sp. AAP83]
MIVSLPMHRRPLAQNLFWAADEARHERPVISMKVRDSFLGYFAANFAAAMVEHCPGMDHRAVRD